MRINGLSVYIWNKCYTIYTLHLKVHILNAYIINKLTFI